LQFELVYQEIEYLMRCTGTPLRIHYFGLWNNLPLPGVRVVRLDVTLSTR
jgi:hypothetical protein